MTELNAQLLVVCESGADFERLSSSLLDGDPTMSLIWSPGAQAAAETLRDNAFDACLYLGTPAGPEIVSELASAQGLLGQAAPLLVLLDPGAPALDDELLSAGAAEVLTPDERAPATLRRQIRRAISQGESLTALHQVLFENRLLSSTVASLDLGVALFSSETPDAPAVFVNRAFEALTGYSGAECIGQPAAFFGEPFLNATLHRPGPGAPTPLRQVGHIRSREQSPLLARVCSAPVQEDGARTHTLCWCSPAFEPSVGAEGQTQLFSAVVELAVASDAPALLHQRGTVQLASPGLARALGLEGPHQLAGASLVGLVHPGDYAQAFSGRPDAPRPPRSFRLRHQDGRWLPLRLESLPLTIGRELAHLELGKLPGR